MTLLVEFGIVFIVLIFAVTQITLPLFGWGRYFWLFRTPEKKLYQIDAEIEEIKLQKAVAEKKKIKQIIQKGDQNGKENDNDPKESNIR